MNIVDQYPKANSFTISGNKEAVLMLHGFTSTPNIFHPLAKFLHQNLGYTIDVPLLSGHGQTPQALDHIESNDWIRDAEDAFNRLLIHYPKIHLIGLSMGGTLCAYLAQRYPNNVSSMTLLAPAMFIRSFLSRIQLKFVRYLPSALLKKWVIFKKDPDKTEQISYHQYSAYSVVQMDGVCRKNSHFKSNLQGLIFVPTQDQTIDPKSSNWFLKRMNPNSKLIQLTQSPHVVFLGKENQMIFNEILNHIKQR